MPSWDWSQDGWRDDEGTLRDDLARSRDEWDLTVRAWEQATLDRMRDRAGTPEARKPRDKREAA